MKKYQSVSVLILCALFTVAAFADETRVPHFENGKPAPGLKNGDVIQEIDGKKVDSPEQAMELVGAPKSPKNLKIIRNGAKKTIEHAK